MPQIKLVTFDVYSALLDIQGGLAVAFARATGMPIGEVRPIVAMWRLKQMERAAASNSLDGQRTSFRDCTRMGLNYVCARFNLDIAADVREELVFAWDHLPLWPEADAAMAAVKQMGYRTAILSNGDQDMLDAVAGLFSTGFDDVLSSESAGYYKPHSAVYALPQTMLGISPAETLHVAGGHTDVVGAVAFGLPCVWSNKTKDQLLDPAFPPDHVIDDLSGLKGLLAVLS